MVVRTILTLDQHGWRGALRYWSDRLLRGGEGGGPVASHAILRWLKERWLDPASWATHSAERTIAVLSGHEVSAAIPRGPANGQRCRCD